MSINSKVYVPMYKSYDPFLNGTNSRIIGESEKYSILGNGISIGKDIELDENQKINQIISGSFLINERIEVIKKLEDDVELLKTLALEDKTLSVQDYFEFVKKTDRFLKECEEDYEKLRETLFKDPNLIEYLNEYKQYKYRELKAKFELN